MSYGVYTLTLKRVNMRNYLTFFILGVEGVVRAMKEFCDFAGAVFAMDANSPPVVIRRSGLAYSPYVGR
jgi:hypothetical protein